MRRRSSVDSAFLLAAGFGSRMRPLSYDLPKPMMPVLGRPAMARLIEMLAAWGVRRILVNVHHNPQAVLDFARRDAPPGVRIDLSFEPEILDTGGALRRAAWFMADDPFWLVNTDIVARTRPGAFLRAFGASPRNIAAVWLHPVEGPRTVELDRAGAVKTFRSPRAGTTGTATFCGLHLLSPRILDFVPDGASSIITAYERAMRAGWSVAGVVPPRAVWRDIGSPSQYLRANENAAGSVIGRGVTVAPGAVVTRSVLWDGAQITRGARIEDSIVGTGVRVAGRLSGGIAVRAGVLPADDPVRRALNGLGWPARETDALYLAPRGSDRSFVRLLHEDRRAILMAYDAERRPENAQFAGIAQFLRAQAVPVPRILLHLPDEHLTVAEDLGDDALEDCAADAPRTQRLRLYRRVLDAVLRLHRIPPDAAAEAGLQLQPPFSAALYEWEHDLFARHFLRARLDLPTRAVNDALRDLALVAGLLLKRPAVLVHRDLQSSNILLRHRAPHFIDFQGLRLGPAVYDLASLLCDPYVQLDAATQHALLDTCIRRAPAGHVTPEAFWLAAVQRLVQALGAFGRLAAQPATARFEARIPAGLAMLRRALDRVPELDGLRRVCGAIPDGRNHRGRSRIVTGSRGRLRSR